jgi:hypothetical protein
MNWDAIGAIAETLGAVGVIASLVYLAGQIRHSREQMGQNTRALRAATYQQFREEIFQAYNSPVATPELLRTLRSGMADFQQLDDEDAFQFDFWAIRLMDGYDNAYYQYRVGMLDDDRWGVQRAVVANLFGNPNIVQWWKANQPIVSPEFVALVSEILGKESGRGDQ